MMTKDQEGEERRGGRRVGLFLGSLCWGEFGASGFGERVWVVRVCGRGG